MSFNGNDIQFLSIPDRVKRLEASTLKKVLGKYLTNPVALTKVVEDLELEVDELEYVESIEFDNDTFKFTILYRDGTTQVIDLPLEQMIVDVTYDDVEKELIFELNNGNTLVVPLDDIISGLISTSDIVDNLTTDDATKVLSAKQGKALEDKKLDKVTTTTTYFQVYTKTNVGTQTLLSVVGNPVVNDAIMQRKNNGLFLVKSGNSASRPNSNLHNGDQYFNTDTKQIEVYIGDANHWLNQVYKSGDTLPTPAVGTSHTYMVIGDGSASDEGLVGLTLGSSTIFNSTLPDDDKHGILITVNNVGGVIYVNNNTGLNVTPSNLEISADYVALKRIG